ncbi:MAG TPA: hypothetical protein DCO70_00845 [Verrucomicrobiales bacterium]|nr:hypothetical protein [Verrucomicrobiales bacterium]|tara:strand:- start:586 stop:2481 length:1896 start_codon:yes stop_codon:yes gene_type:complete
MSQSNPTDRFHSLDFLRAVAMYLGVIIHTSCFFGFYHPMGLGWAEYYPDPFDNHIVNWIHLFRMQFFFIIAGFFGELVCRKKGTGYFAGNRFKRILIPFVVGCLIVVPLCDAAITTYNGEFAGKWFFERAMELVLFEFHTGNHHFPEISFAHFWFVWFLMFYYAIHWFARVTIGSRLAGLKEAFIRFADVCVTKTYGIFVLAAVFFFLLLIQDSAFFPPRNAGLDLGFHELAFYLVCYGFGCCLFYVRDFIGKVTSNLKLNLAIVICFTFWIHGATDAIDEHTHPAVDISSWRLFNFQVFSDAIFYGGADRYLVIYVRCLLCFAWCFIMFALGERFFGRKNEMVRYFADASYWVYWAHLPVTAYFSFLLQPYTGLNTLFKCYLALVISTVLIMIPYMLMVRNTFLGDYFCGWRKPMNEDPFIKFLKSSWQKLVSKTVVVGVVVFFVGEVIHVATVSKRISPMVEAYIQRDESFLRNFEEINHTNGFGQNALHIAVKRVPVKHRLYDSVSVLLERGIDVNHRDKFGRTPLYMACRYGDKSDIEKLLKAGADPNIQENRFGHSPLQVVAIKLGGTYLKGRTKGGDGKKAIEGYKDIYRMLIAHGANLALKDKQGRAASGLLARYTPFTMGDLK